MSDNTPSKNHSLGHDLRINWRSLMMVQRLTPGALPVILALALLEAAAPFVNIFLPARILDELLGARDQERLLFLVSTTIGLNLVINLAVRGLTQARTYQMSLISLRFNQAIAQKSVTMDFIHAENPKTQELRQLFQEGHNSLGGVQNHMRIFGMALKDIISVIVSCGVVLQLFFLPQTGGLSGLLAFIDSPKSALTLMVLMALTMILGAVINMYTGKLSFKINEVNVPVNRKAGYLMETVFNDYRFGKDIRLYNMSKMLLHELNDFVSITMSRFREMILKEGLPYESFSIALSTLLTGAIYIYVGLKALIGAISVGSIVLYVGAISQFNTGFAGLVKKISDLRLQCLYAAAYQDYLALPDVKHQGSLPVPSAPDGRYEIEFKNVSFRYPGSEELMLHNISLKMRAGERLAVVGMNGAGKTTFIKLLCRLYDPTEGEILLNGVDIREIDYQEYLKMFSVVFQDFKLFALPVGQNIAATLQYDDDKASRYLEQAGVYERVQRMPHGLDTYLYKNFENDGVEISGGEAQKIGIARALYKDAPFVILDEPTAALDPISEFEIYSTFDTLVGKKSAVYISHRLSSCRFCHDIAVFHEGRLIQRGNHEELVADPNGKYAEMWNAQAQYYIEERAEAAGGQ